VSTGEEERSGEATLSALRLPSKVESDESEKKMASWWSPRDLLSSSPSIDSRRGVVLGDEDKTPPPAAATAKSSLPDDGTRGKKVALVGVVEAAGGVSLICGCEEEERSQQ